MLRRLKGLGASTEDLLDVYRKQILCISEYAAPVWHSSITNLERMEIEIIQKIAFNIILGGQYCSYSYALKTLGMDTLYRR